MEKRAILAAVLMAALLVIYQYFFFPASPTEPPATPPPSTSAPTPKADAPQPAPPPTATAPPATPPQPAKPAAPAGPRPPQRTAIVDAPLYRAVISSEGGKLQEWTLKYRGEKPMIAVGEFASAGLQVAVGQSALEPVPMALGQLDAARDGASQLVLTGEADGMRIRQSLRFPPKRYAIEADIRIENPTTEPRTVTVAIPWIARRHEKVPHDEKFIGQRPTEVVWTSDGRIHRQELTAVTNEEATGEWIALDSTWYLTALQPKTPGFKLVATAENGKDPKNGLVTIGVRAVPTIAPGQSWEGRVAFYVGPKEYDRLVESGLEATLNFGSFLVPQNWTGGQPVLPMKWLAVPILKLLDWVYGYVGNYGIAIILLTVVSKVIFYPLTVKSMRSMKAMQALQPQINALRSKFKSDPRKLQEETMSLYRKHHVNPMGGCLPMVAQIPIFYALYLALGQSVELQNSPFLCFGHLPTAFPFIGGAAVWICDLANPDPTYILPLLMGLTMFMQQKMTPTMGDPRQAKMMLVMPFLFTWMFLGLASGLVLYWTVSNLLQILQQWYMDRPRSRGTAREAKDAARA